MNSDIKIIFTDIDWTLLSHHTRPAKLDKASVRYLNKLHDKGVKIVVSTARPYHSFLDTEVSKKLKYDGLILSSGSLTIFNDEVVHEEDLLIKDFEALSKVALKYDGNLEGIRTYDSFIIRQMNEPIKYVFEAYPSRIPEVLGIHRKKVNKATLYFYKEDYENIINDIPKHLHHYRFHDNAIDVSAKLTTKGVAVKHLLNHLGISKENAAAIGDGFSDSTMFKEVKYSVAMSNAPKEVKDSAKYVTKDTLHHGVKFAFKRLIK